MKSSYISIALGICGALVGTSCADDLDQLPHIEQTTESLYQTLDDYEAVLAKIYSTYCTAGNEKGSSNDMTSINGQDFGRCLYNLQEVTTDEVAATWLESDKQTELTYHTWDANQAWVNDTYYRCYYNITLCNEFLNRTEDSEIARFSESEQKVLRQYRAEARYNRAFYYYWVLDLWRKGPKALEENVGKSSAPDVWDAKGIFDFVESELKECSELMLSRDESVYARAPRAAAWMLLTRLYLNAEVYIGTSKYDECIAYAQKVIDEGYELNEDYAQLFNADNDKRTNEIILHAAVDNTNTVTWGTTTLMVCGAVPSDKVPDDYDREAMMGSDKGWGSMRAQSQLVDAFEDESDARYMFHKSKDDIKVVTNPLDQGHGYFVMKWTNLNDNGEAVGSATANGVSTDMPIFRLAEAYLNLAEAVARGGNGATKAEAAELINKLRTRAGVSSINESNITTDYLFGERTREMYWELTRRTDLVRYDRFTSGSYLWDLKQSAIDSKYNYFPIPQSELTANPNLSNPEY